MKLTPALILASAAIYMFTGCSNGSGGVSRTDRNASAVQAAAPRSQSPKDSAFEAGDGVVVYVGNEEKLARSSGLITIYGKEGDPLKVINRDDESIDSLSGEVGDFYPFYFSNGASRDFGIEFRAVRRSKDWTEVVIHETREPKALGYIRADDPLFKFESWPDWVKGHSNIRFDAKSDPVLDSPNGEAKKVSFPEEPLIKADEVRGDWVLIRWTKLEPDEPAVGEIAEKHPENSGWIMWRKDGKVLISDYYP